MSDTKTPVISIQTDVVEEFWFPSVATNQLLQEAKKQGYDFVVNVQHDVRYSGTNSDMRFNKVHAVTTGIPLKQDHLIPC